MALPPDDDILDALLAADEADAAARRMCPINRAPAGGPWGAIVLVHGAIACMVAIFSICFAAPSVAAGLGGRFAWGARPLVVFLTTIVLGLLANGIALLGRPRLRIYGVLLVVLGIVAAFGSGFLIIVAAAGMAD
ncbi:MAG: hypothetical protein ACRELB_05005 [Polyangiaceae bacterium]